MTVLIAQLLIFGPTYGQEPCVSPRIESSLRWQRQHARTVVQFQRINIVAHQLGAHFAENAALPPHRFRRYAGQATTDNIRAGTPSHARSPKRRSSSYRPCGRSRRGSRRRAAPAGAFAAMPLGRRLRLRALTRLGRDDEAAVDFRSLGLPWRWKDAGANRSILWGECVYD
jgi:hypothetical protein